MNREVHALTIEKSSVKKGGVDEHRKFYLPCGGERKTYILCCSGWNRKKEKEMMTGYKSCLFDGDSC